MSTMVRKSSPGPIAALPVTLEYQTPRPFSPAPQPLDSEQVLYQDGKVLVTHARLVVGDKTYVIAHITSVELTCESGESRGRVIPTFVASALLFLGLVATLGGVANGSSGGLAITLGLLAAVFGITVLAVPRREQPAKFLLRLETLTGRQTVLAGPDPAIVGTVAAALNRAIILNAPALNR